jgi:predicted MPP superfamily phosphohydrolase
MPVPWPYVLAGAAVVAAAGFAWYAVRVAPHRVEFVRRPLPVENLPSGLAGRTLVHISDIHAGGLMRDRHLTDTFEAVTRLAPDLVVWTGDFVSFRFGDPLPRLASVLRHAPHGRLGSFAVLGNHDYGHGHPGSAYHEHLALAVTEALGHAGITALRNASRIVEGLAIVGLDEHRSGRFDLARALHDVPPGTPTVFLCHNPDAFDRSEWSGLRGWILAGHTHGGQVKLPGLPAPVLQIRNRRYSGGEAEAAPGRRVYVARGLGYILPLRFNVPPEVTVFTLERA